jgi:hypothetical protein
MTDCWTVRYRKGDYQTVHNHKSWGFSLVLYVEYDPKVHTPTTFVCPWQDPRTDTTSLICPQDVQEGTSLLFLLIHFIMQHQIYQIKPEQLYQQTYFLNYQTTNL